MRGILALVLAAMAAAISIPASAEDPNVELAMTAPQGEWSVRRVMSGPLRVTVDGTEPGRGEVRANLYASPDSFLVQEDAQRAVAVPLDGSPLVEFEDLPPGDYAVVVYYDLNGNQTLDRGLFGVPMEPIGFSNGVVPLFSAPRFEDVRVRHEGGPLDIEIVLRNLS